MCELLDLDRYLRDKREIMCKFVPEVFRIEPKDSDHFFGDLCVHKGNISSNVNLTKTDTKNSIACFGFPYNVYFQPLRRYHGVS